LLQGLGLSAALGLSACSSTARVASRVPPALLSRPGVDPAVAALYGAVEGEPFPVPALDFARIDPVFLRREVDYAGAEAPGTIVVDPAARFLYLVAEGGRALRYGVGVGKEGFTWSGIATVNSKQEWPDWYPTAEMLERRPDIVAMLEDLPSGRGIAGGPRNPLGARGLYLWQGKVDTLYRIHGTTEPYTIGQSVSSGCIRMTNEDVIDLYDRTPVGTKVVVLPARVA